MSAPDRLRVHPLPIGGDAPVGGLLVGDREDGARIEWLDREHAILAEEPPTGGGVDLIRTRLVLGPTQRRVADGVRVREVLIDGWRVEVELEAERRAALRDRARRGASPDGPAGPSEIRAELPGRVARVLVAIGDLVAAGQPLIVIEAMKMLNEVRAPRAGRIDRIAVAVPDPVELGQTLVVLR
jgi:biotin carboxyl carrier protein